jgi:hypothetical protein
VHLHPLHLIKHLLLPHPQCLPLSCQLLELSLLLSLESAQLLLVHVLDVAEDLFLLDLCTQLFLLSLLQVTQELIHVLVLGV